MFICGPGETTWDGDGIVPSLLISEGDLGSLAGDRTHGVATEQRQAPWASPALQC